MHSKPKVCMFSPFLQDLAMVKEFMSTALKIHEETRGKCFPILLCKHLVNEDEMVKQNHEKH